MSQRGSASRPASRRSPKTSPEPAFSSPRLSQPSPQASNRPQDDAQAPTYDPGGPSSVMADDGGRPASSGARTSDVHGILNASESHHQYSGGTTTFSGQPTEAERMERSRPTMAGQVPHRQGVSPVNPYVFQGQQPPAMPQQAYPPLAPSTALGLPTSSAQRGSPTIGPPLPPLGVPRRILTPRSPRVTSLSRAARMNEELQRNPLPRQPSLPGSASSHDVSPRSGPTVLGGPAQRALPQPQSLGTAPPPPTHSPVAARSLSQPIVGHTLPPTLTADYLHSSNRPALPASGSTRIPSQPHFPRETPTSVIGGETRWSTGSYGSLAGLPWGRGLPVGESQHLLTITPQYGEEIVVPVDTHQGSKTQDQKRQKNAIASARFRTRKKEREHQLEVDNHEMGLRVRELEAERDFYRNERNRLRDIVSRTPSISEWANGPPSPVSNRDQGNFPTEGGPIAGASHSQGGSDQSMTGSPARRRRGPQPRSPNRIGGSYVAESSTMAGAPRPQGHPYAHPPPYSYGPPELSMAEPPARRRRIEHEPQFTTPTYGSVQPTTLPPPMAQATYGLNPQRHPPTSPGMPRLPPLRMDQPSPTSEHLPQPGPAAGAPPPPLPQQVQHQTPYTPAYNRSYESSWPQAPQGPQEGGQR
ncbi:hypothetical protein CONLIGDRAFT_640602 [Coniochaeta ligniaria NRRL 30616]|uniref:BZIP domain-containing protein n=1 Tax=Coniochaeta ligniaria NRRL 30616 TaxID=1408157 RepID=A0A1J7K048_9PEZI|nr:hypothetical protein CONLIGDRAFT_640602 [Coniochaeta ligniaria NRRL 30616]